MKTSRTTLILITPLGLVLAAGTLGAFQGSPVNEQPPGPPRARPEASGGPAGQGLVNELGLTEQQRQQMRALHNEGRTATIRSRADLELKRMELEELLEADEPNQAALDKALRELNELRAASFKRRIEHRLAFRRLLTAEQRAKLRNFREQRGGFLRQYLRHRWMDAPEGRGRHRRGPGFGRGEDFGRGQGFGPRGRFGPGAGMGPGFGGGPDFDLDLETELDPEPEF